MNEYSEEFKFWYERFFLQSPSLCALQYDDEKMWEAWSAGYKEGIMAGFKLTQTLTEKQNNA